MRVILIAFFAVLAAPAIAVEHEESGSAEKNYSTGLFECNKFSWLENCEKINRQAEEHPDTPFRITDPTGLEFNFAPGTPSVTMRHLLNPTLETAKAQLAYERAHTERAELAAKLVRDVIAAEGGQEAQYLALSELSSVRSQPAQTLAKDKQLDTNEFKLFVFYDSNCAYCHRLIPELATLKKRHQGLQMSLLQINQDDSFKALLETQLNQKVNYIPEDRRAEYAKIVKGTPTILIKTDSSNQNTLINGFRTAAALEKIIKKAL